VRACLCPGDDESTEWKCHDESVGGTEDREQLCADTWHTPDGEEVSFCGPSVVDTKLLFDQIGRAKGFVSSQTCPFGRMDEQAIIAPYKVICAPPHAPP
jgi:hypothetical protein